MLIFNAIWLLPFQSLSSSDSDNCKSSFKNCGIDFAVDEAFVSFGMFATGGGEPEEAVSIKEGIEGAFCWICLVSGTSSKSLSLSLKLKFLKNEIFLSDFQTLWTYLPLEDEPLLEDSERSILLTVAAACDIWLLLETCGDADRLKGFGVPAVKNNGHVDLTIEKKKAKSLKLFKL